MSTQLAQDFFLRFFTSRDFFSPLACLKFENNVLTLSQRRSSGVRSPTLSTPVVVKCALCLGRLSSAGSGRTSDIGADGTAASSEFPLFSLFVFCSVTLPVFGSVVNRLLFNLVVSRFFSPPRQSLSLSGWHHPRALRPVWSGARWAGGLESCPLDGRVPPMLA